MGIRNWLARVKGWIETSSDVVFKCIIVCAVVTFLLFSANAYAALVKSRWWFVALPVTWFFGTPFAYAMACVVTDVSVVSKRYQEALRNFLTAIWPIGYAVFVVVAVVYTVFLLLIVWPLAEKARPYTLAVLLFALFWELFCLAFFAGTVAPFGLGNWINQCGPVRALHGGYNLVWLPGLAVVWWLGRVPAKRLYGHGGGTGENPIRFLIDQIIIALWPILHAVGAVIWASIGIRGGAIGFVRAFRSGPYINPNPF